MRECGLDESRNARNRNRLSQHHTALECAILHLPPRDNPHTAPSKARNQQKSDQISFPSCFDEKTITYIRTIAIALHRHLSAKIFVCQTRRPRHNTIFQKCWQAKQEKKKKKSDQIQSVTVKSESTGILARLALERVNQCPILAICVEKANFATFANRLFCLQALQISIGMSKRQQRSKLYFKEIGR